MAYFSADTEIYKRVFKQDDLYYSENFPWVKGLVLNKNPHITLLYGLLESVKLEHVETVLKGWNPPKFEIDYYDYFESPNDEEYYCIIGKIKLTPEILEAHQRLSLLPHINTFFEYKPHLTIAYIKKDKLNLGRYLDLLTINPFERKLGICNPHLEYQNCTYDNNTNPQTIKL